jgi:hypothetical protein
MCTCTKWKTKYICVSYLLLVGSIGLAGNSLDAHGNALLDNSLGGVLGASVIDDNIASTGR